jgi:hypothetical protein
MVTHPSCKDANGFGGKIVAHGNLSISLGRPFRTPADPIANYTTRPAGWNGL